MILLSQRRWTAVAIADLLGCHPVTVRRWIHRYNSGGVAALADRLRPGRPSQYCPAWSVGVGASWSKRTKAQSW
jgi:hypothetical protein